MGDGARSLLTLLLRQAGLRVVTGTATDLVLIVPGHGPRHLALKQIDHQLTRSIVAHTVEADLPYLYVARSATAAVVSAAQAGSYDLVTFDPPRVIVAARPFLEPEPKRADTEARRNPTWGGMAVLRTMVTIAEPLRQTDLARIVGISQQAVSGALKRADAHVQRVDGGWVATKGALQAWLDDYSGPGGTVTHWYGLDDPVEQAREALGLLDDLDLTAIVSGDLAADRYSPWQIPGTVGLYLPEYIDFTPVGFAPAKPDEATMVVVVPQDPTIARVAEALSRSYIGRHLLADPAITLWDLNNMSTTSTAREAAHHLATAIAEGKLDAWRRGQSVVAARRQD